MTIEGQKQYPDADDRFDNAPYFNFNDGKVKFDTNDVSNPNDNYGSASGFLSKSLLIKNTRQMAGILLSFSRFDPAAKLTTNFVDNSFQGYVFLVVYRLGIFH